MGTDGYNPGNDSWGDSVFRRGIALGQPAPLLDKELQVAAEAEMYSRWRKDRVRTLQAIPLFSTLSRRHLKRMTQHFVEKRVEAGTVLTEQGQPASDFVLILSGTARVEKDGNLVGHLQAGDFCGEMSLIDGEPRSATVTVESTANLVTFDRSAFQELLESVPGMQKEIMGAMCRHLREVDAALTAVN